MHTKRIGKERDAYCAAAIEEGLRAAEYAKWIRRNKQKAVDENSRLKKENAELYVLLKVARGIEELKDDKAK